MASSGTNTKRRSTEKEDDRILEESLHLACSKAVCKEKRLHERSVETQQKAKRLRVEIERMTKQAERMDRQIQKFKSDEEDATNSRQILTLESILLRLRRNDKDTTEVLDRTLPSGYGKAVGKALRQNTRVSKLHLTFPHCLSSTSEAGAAKEMEPLLKFIAKDSLIDLAVGLPRGQVGSEFQKISHSLLEAVAKCTCIERLRWDLPMDASAFHRIMTNLPGLKELVLLSKLRFSEDERQTIAASFQSTNALEKLDLNAPSDSVLIGQILSNVSNVSCLRELSVATSVTLPDSLPALCQLLGSANALERFEMSDTYLNGDVLTSVLSALQLERLVTLAFRNCAFVRQGDVILAAMLQMQTTNNKGEIVNNSSLHELHISDAFGMDEAVSRLLTDSILTVEKDVGVARDDANDVTAGRRPLLVYRPTIGSQIECLSLGWVHASFFDSFRDNASRVRLQSLELIGLSKAGCIAFCKCIPFLTTIRKLKLRKLNLDGLLWVLNGLKNNGSICNVIATDDDDQSDFSPRQLRLVQAYCQRNTLLDQLIASEPDAASSKDNRAAVDRDVGSAAGASGRDDEAVPTQQSAELLVRPPLLLASQQVPSTHLTVLMRGLVVLGRCAAKQEE